MQHIATVQVFKRGSKWCAHVYWKDGKVWPCWQYGFKTKRDLMANITAACSMASVDACIERGIDE